jgi:hypothetical protein
MNREFVTICWISIFVGWILGMITAAILLVTPISSWTNKTNLMNKKTVIHPMYYAQYSAVRRFPK